MYDVITVGSATVDVFAHTDSELIKILTPNSEEDRIAYPAGSKILIKNLEFKIGGGGTNTAVSFSRLGLDTAFLGKIGKDSNGEKIKELLRTEDIDFIGKEGSEKTGYSVILDSIEHDRTILTYKDCNNGFSWNEVSKSALKTKWFYFSSMMGKSLETLKKLADHAKKNNIKVAFNPSNYLIKENYEDVVKILSNTDVLVFNMEEAKLLCKDYDVKTLLDLCHQFGPGIVAITDGSKGCYASDGENKYRVKAHNIKVKESTGAGDAFASTFVTGIVKGLGVKESLDLGMVNAESVIRNIGAKEVLLDYSTASKKRKRRPHKVEMIK
ncbi:MAG: carbohydrate kinase family protein [Nanobdellota archaeon]